MIFLLFTHSCLNSNITNLLIKETKTRIFPVHSFKSTYCYYCRLGSIKTVSGGGGDVIMLLCCESKGKIVLTVELPLWERVNLHHCGNQHCCKPSEMLLGIGKGTELPVGTKKMFLNIL